MRTEVTSRLVKASRVVIALTIVAGTLSVPAVGTAADDSRTFPETGKTVSGRFLEYWDANGGLAQQGFPVSEEMEEQSDTDGKTYTVQYFERAVFESHPENARPYDVLLSLLGTFYYGERHDGNASGQKASTTNSRKFVETGKTIGGVFRRYWETHGGLAQQGFPISNEFQEKNPEDGKTYTVQYFQRAIFERHPENAGTPSEVLLSRLGYTTYGTKYAGGAPPSGEPPAPTLSTEIFSKLGWTNIVATTNNIVLFHNVSNGDLAIARISDSGIMTPLFEITGNGPNPITHMVAGSNNFLYTYDKGSGKATIHSVSDNGILQVEHKEQWQAGWSHIAIDTETGLGLCYNSTTGQGTTFKTNPDGTTTNLKAMSTPASTPWLYFLPVGDGVWLFEELMAYDAANVPGVYVPGVGVYRMDDTGLLSRLYQIPLFPIWTHYVFDKTNVLLHNQESGAAMTLKVTADDFKILQSFSGWQTTWDKVVATNNGLIIFYGSSTSRISIDRFGADGNYTHQNRYP